jgi:leucyl/phenylalanyl-tRNA---protein transferase
MEATNIPAADPVVVQRPPDADAGPVVPPDPLALPALVAAYACGYFVMDDVEDGVATLRFESPPVRAILPLDPVKVERWKTKRRTPYPAYAYRTDTAFEEVLVACAEPRDNDLAPFMTPRVLDAYRMLHRAGFAHSIEAWDPDADSLVAATLGVSLGRAYMIESTFHRVSGAGNAVLIATMDLLIKQSCELCDLQFTSDHVARYGAHEIPRDEYLRRLREAMLPPNREEG